MKSAYYKKLGSLTLFHSPIALLYLHRKSESVPMTFYGENKEFIFPFVIKLVTFSGLNVFLHPLYM